MSENFRIINKESSPELTFDKVLMKDPNHLRQF